MDRPQPPLAELTARFAADLAALGPSRCPLGVAVSGGPDSVALLLLAHAAMPGGIEAATVDHGLRAEAADEAAFAASICAALGVPHATLKVTLAPGNLQAEARVARYAALADWATNRGLAAIATAHHADDQAETLLLRLNRASGVAGLAGVRATGQTGPNGAVVLRPLLGWRREELAAVVAAAGIKAVQDPSNIDEKFDRARIRKAIAEASWLDVPALAASAVHLADADAALDWAAAREWAAQVERTAMGIIYRPHAPRAIALRVLTRIVTELDGEVPRGSTIARLFDALVARQPMSIGNLVARALPEGWNFMKAPARRKPSPSKPILLHPPQQLRNDQ